MKISELKTAEEVLAEDLKDPEFRKEWVRTAPERLLALTAEAAEAAEGVEPSSADLQSAT